VITVIIAKKAEEAKRVNFVDVKENEMKKKGFTLIELLVVIAIIAMLLAILMPALNKVKRLAQRLVCATNLKGMGTALMVYSNDDKYEQYPVQGGTGNHTWSDKTAGYANTTKDWSSDGNITVGASLFLLVREADVDPKSFVCKSSDQKAYEGQHHMNEEIELVELNDFGNWDKKPEAAGTGPVNCVSYAYQLPYSVGNDTARPASSTASAQFALMADRNPWFNFDLSETDYDENNGSASLGYVWRIEQDWDGEVVNKLQIQQANSAAHNREGQNVLFNDGHAEFLKRSDIGVENDNIYTIQGGSTDPRSEKQRRRGAAIRVLDDKGPQNAKDNWLVNDTIEANWSSY
jgi:prepilin-type N-terminal cleavage/methylation domain-containing protein